MVFFPLRLVPRLLAGLESIGTKTVYVPRTFSTTSRVGWPTAKKPEAKLIAPVHAKATKTSTKAAKPKKRVTVKDTPRNIKVAVNSKPKKTIKPVQPEPPRKLKPEERPPKQPGSAYTVFTTKYISDSRSSGEDVKELVRKAGAAWQELTEAEREPFFEEWRKRRAQYLIKRERYWDARERPTINLLNKERAMRGKNKIHSYVSPENKRPVSAYITFCQDRRRDPDIYKQVEHLEPMARVREIFTLLAKEWKALDADKKQSYQIPAKERLDAWKERQLGPST